MSQLTRNENIWSAAIGILIGSMAGLIISLSIVKEHKKCEVLKKENQLLKDMIMQYQEREYVAY